MSKRACIVTTVLFLVFIGGFCLLIFVMPDRTFSEQENRYLQQLPDFSLEALEDGSFMASFEKYTTDQFPFRDAWTTLKAGAELAQGKSENNGVYYCEGGLLIERATRPDPAQTESNIAALNTFSENVDVPVYLQLVPNSGSVWEDALPENAPFYNQKDLIHQIYSQVVDVTTIDVSSVLDAHKDEYIYYHTDHHWTTLGAFYAYQAAAEAMGLTPREKSDFTPEIASDSFYGTVYSTSGFSWVPPDTIEYWVQEPAGLQITNYPKGEPVEGVLYDRSFLQKKDKYSSFFGGNTPMLDITTGADADLPVLLVIRDSYADCQNPFWFEDFSRIIVVDLRYYKGDIDGLVRDEGVDSVLLTYSAGNFASDKDVFFLSQ